MSDTSCFSACCGCCAISCFWCKNGRAPTYWRTTINIQDAPEYKIKGCVEAPGVSDTPCFGCGSPCDGRPTGCCCPPCGTFPNGGEYCTHLNPSRPQECCLSCNGYCTHWREWTLTNNCPDDPFCCFWAQQINEAGGFCPSTIGGTHCPSPGGVFDSCCADSWNAICESSPSTCESFGGVQALIDSHCPCPYKCGVSHCKGAGVCLTPFTGSMWLDVVQVMDSPYGGDTTITVAVHLVLGNGDCGAAWAWRKDFITPFGSETMNQPDCTKPIELELYLEPSEGPCAGWCTGNYGCYPNDLCGNTAQNAWRGCDMHGTTITISPVFETSFAMSGPMRVANIYDRPEKLLIKKDNIVLINKWELKRRKVLSDHIVNKYKVSKAMAGYGFGTSIKDWKNCNFQLIDDKIKEKAESISREEVEVVTEKVSLFKKLKNLGTSMINWNREGRPLRSEKEIADIYDNICTKCPFFQDDQCGLCGCQIKREGVVLNKLAFATESCPDKPARWGPKSLPVVQAVIPEAMSNIPDVIHHSNFTS